MPKRSSLIETLTQEDLVKVLRNMLKVTENHRILTKLEQDRVRSLCEAIQPATWKKMYERHFAKSVEEGKAAECYLAEYIKNRFGTK